MGKSTGANGMTQLIKIIKTAIRDLNTAISGKASSNHNHDDRYYTESEINNNLNDIKNNYIGNLNVYDAEDDDGNPYQYTYPVMTEFRRMYNQIEHINVNFINKSNNKWPESFTSITKVYITNKTKDVWTIKTGTNIWLHSLSEDDIIKFKPTSEITIQQDSTVEIPANNNSGEKLHEIVLCTVSLFMSSPSGVTSGIMFKEKLLFFPYSYYTDGIKIFITLKNPEDYTNFKNLIIDVEECIVIK